MRLKNTRQRAALLRILEQAAEPLSAEELYRRMKREFPPLALSTVYRNLERFTAGDLVEKDVFGDGVTRYSLARGEHGHYLVCTGCNTKIRIGECPLAGLARDLARDTGFEIEGHSLTIYGKCPRCAGAEGGAKPKAPPQKKPGGTV